MRPHPHLLGADGATTYRKTSDGRREKGGNRLTRHRYRSIDLDVMAIRASLLPVLQEQT